METRQTAATRDALHRLIDALPEQDLASARRAIEQLADPFLLALANAPYDDEAESEEERAAVAEAVDDVAHGRTRPWADVRRELASE